MRALHPMRLLMRVLSRFLEAKEGGVALWTAVCLPPLAVISIGAVELVSVSADRAKMQEAADTAALTAARELGYSGPGGVIERAQVNALTPLAGIAERTTLEATATLAADERTVTVVITGNRMSFFGNLLPPGGFNTRAESSATALGSKPLCVVGMQSSSGVNIHLQNTSRIQSPGCLIQSNRDVQVDNLARIQAGEVQVSGRATGRIDPAALTGAPVLPDAYASTNVVFPMSCNVGDILTVVQGANVTLQPGLHCGDININNGTLTLAPGDHFFRRSQIKVDSSGTLTGDGVTMFFDNQSALEAKSGGTVNLLGRRTGPWAGFLIVGPRTAGLDFKFESDNVNRLEGVIYLPNNKLLVSGSNQVAEGSNWTVTLAKIMEVRGSVALVINVDYAASDVPVPVGVGPTPGTRLRR